MKFFDRENEIRILRDIREKSRRNAQFVVVTGAQVADLFLQGIVVGGDVISG